MNTLASSHQSDTNSLPAVTGGYIYAHEDTMTNLSKAITSIAVGMALGTAGDFGIATSQWLASVIVITVGFVLIVNGFVLLGTQSCVK
jgi:hypothetical protein